jgi:hypothetical protein
MGRLLSKSLARKDNRVSSQLAKMEACLEPSFIFASNGVPCLPPVSCCLHGMDRIHEELSGFFLSYEHRGEGLPSRGTALNPQVPDIDRPPLMMG